MSGGSELISVVMPVRNGAAHIVPAVRSVLDQDWPRFEVIVVDDGSTDGTSAAVGRLLDSRVRVIDSPGRGIVAALNRGLDEAAGALIARMDADDVMMPGRLTAQADFLARHPGVVACGTDYELFGDQTGRVRTPRTPAQCRARLLFGSPMSHPTVLIRSSALAGLRYRADYGGAEDFKLFAELAAVGDLANLPVIGLRYRRHAGQVSSAGRARQRELHLRICRENLTAIGAPPVSDTVLAGWLWPTESDEPVGPSRYLRRAPMLLRTAGRAAGAAGITSAVWLVRENLATMRAARRSSRTDPDRAAAAG